MNKDWIIDNYGVTQGLEIIEELDREMATLEYDNLEEVKTSYDPVIENLWEKWNSKKTILTESEISQLFGEF